MAMTTMTKEEADVVMEQRIVRLQVADENRRQLARWDVQDHSPIYWLGILMEEVGEAAEAIIATTALNQREEMIADAIYQLGLRAKAYVEDDKADRITAAHAPHDLGTELIHCAAVAVAAEENRRRRVSQ